MRDEILVKIRSGRAASTRLRVARIKPATRWEQPHIFLCDEHGVGAALISGRDTLRKLRDALTLALGESESK